MNFLARLIQCFRTPAVLEASEEEVRAEFRQTIRQGLLGQPKPTALKPGWDRMPKSEGAWQPPPPDHVPVSKDWVPPPRIIPVIVHRLNGDDTVCGLHTLEASDKGKFTKQVDQPGLTLFHYNIVGDEERTANCATCFAEHLDSKDAHTGYLAKAYLYDKPPLEAPKLAPTTDEKGRVPPTQEVAQPQFHEEAVPVGNGSAWMAPQEEYSDPSHSLAEQWLLTEEDDEKLGAQQTLHMSAEQFAYWLQGVFEVQNPESLNADQIKIIKEHLALVLTHVSGPVGYVTAPSYCGTAPRRCC